MSMMLRRAMMRGIGGLPAGYQRVDYVESNSNTAYVNTGVVGAYEMDIDFNATSDARTLYGSTVQPGNYFGVMATGEYEVRGTNAYLPGTNGRVRGVLHVSRGSGEISITFGGQTAATTGTLTGTLNLFRIATNYYGTSRIYRATIWQDGIKVREFVPCYQISGSVGGLYDLANGEFYPSSGSTPLDYGNL